MLKKYADALDRAFDIRVAADRVEMLAGLRYVTVLIRSQYPSAVTAVLDDGDELDEVCLTRIELEGGGQVEAFDFPDDLSDGVHEAVSCLSWRVLRRELWKMEHLAKDTGGRRNDSCVLDLAAIECLTDDDVALRCEVVAETDSTGYGVSVETFVDGVPLPCREHVVDAQAGWMWEDWKERRDEALEQASPAARALLLKHYAKPDGGEYVEDREVAWLHDLPACVTDEEVAAALVG